MLNGYPGGKEALLDEVRAGRTSPEIEACVLAGQKVCGAPSPPPRTLTLTPTLTQALTLTLTPTLALTLALTLT
jgi:hypothetical protein